MNKIYSFFVLLIATSLFLESCKKGGGGIDEVGPGPDGGQKELILPQKEMRGAWIATVWALDWPRTADFQDVTYDVTIQKESYKAMLDMLKSKGFNTVFVQVRGMGDAFYNSSYEPWSASISGVRGKDPGYDALQFMIDEAHSRGLEFHAWINPYRISTRASAASVYPALHSSVDPSWVVDHEKIRIYNPALPAVRQRLADIVKDIVTKYNVDGLHMDDYFYPDPASAGVMKADDTDFQQYKGSFTDIKAWRRDNVDKAIQLIFNTIKDNKPQVVFSISPAASKDYNYNTLYADLGKWCKEGWVDILIPQLYQEIGNSANDYKLNLAIWSQYSYNARLVIGHALYKFGVQESPQAFQSTQELVNQFELSKKNAKAVGSVMYSARDVYYNRKGITDQLSQLYSHKAIIPFAGRQVAAPSTTPANVVLSGNELSWATQSGSNIRYAIYYFADLEKEGTLIDVVTSNKVNVAENGYYSVTSLNVDHLESKPSSPIRKQ
ncbi:glycoside hydrolase family 10 protein [Sphingobacterium faecale]|uniref:Family 10 glycosylhydrolase n=1 Tax=Sphingobacterium faecale TaxID=2803775 RepID=A0ABS1R7W5_9SPHI|nr:family 10 glycosylhydrolase [Sphingobacterium faecale]MBL1410773.1 family 10 glycosylhydrolase [Sphingobacterium faecale]